MSSSRGTVTVDRRAQPVLVGQRRQAVVAEVETLDRAAETLLAMLEDAGDEHDWAVSQPSVLDVARHVAADTDFLRRQLASRRRGDR